MHMHPLRPPAGLFIWVVVYLKIIAELTPNLWEQMFKFGEIAIQRREQIIKRGI
jgi:hypothetical protein